MEALKQLPTIASAKHQGQHKAPQIIGPLDTFGIIGPGSFPILLSAQISIEIITESFAAAPSSGFYTPSLNMSINTKANKGVFEVLGIPMLSNLQSSTFHA